MQNFFYRKACWIIYPQDHTRPILSGDWFNPLHDNEEMVRISDALIIIHDENDQLRLLDSDVFGIKTNVFVAKIKFSIFLFSL